MPLIPTSGIYTVQSRVFWGVDIMVDIQGIYKYGFYGDDLLLVGHNNNKDLSR